MYAIWRCILLIDEIIEGVNQKLDEKQFSEGFSRSKTKYMHDKYNYNKNEDEMRLDGITVSKYK